MPKLLTTYEQILSVAQPAPLSVRVERKRLYDFSDMWALANAVVGEDKPATSIDYWLKRAGVVPKGSTPRRAKYWHSHLEYFFLYCACRRFCSHNNQEANRVYDELSTQ